MIKKIETATCDRCSKSWIIRENEVQVGSEVAPVKFMVRYNNRANWYDKELCPECSVQLKDWISGYKKE